MGRVVLAPTTSRQGKGAIMSPNEPEGYRAALDSAALFDVSGRGKILAEGNDAVVFLHNLSSNDGKKLAPHTGCELFFCTATAKVVAHGRAYREAPAGKRERLMLDVGEGQNEKLFHHLDHFLIGEDVTLTDRTAELAQLHLAGPRVADVLRAACDGAQPPSEAPHSFREVDLPGDLRVTVRESRLVGLPGFDLLFAAERLTQVRQRLLDAGAVEAGREAYQALRVENGVPEYGSDVDETTFAPEVGRKDAISYQKGCYLGQEPIVMARDRGVVQRTLVGLLVGDEAAPRGALLFREGKEVGRVTSGVCSPRFGWIALGYARRGSQAPGTELEMDVGGARRAVKVSTLPFGG
jgi:tRNA-modifying protein YgfZ